MRGFALLPILLLAACVTGAGEPPAPPTAVRAVALEVEPPAALDGRATFTLAGRGAGRFVALLETARATLAVADDGTLLNLSGTVAHAVARDVLPEVRASADGRRVAFAIRSGDAIADVHVLVDGSVRRLTEGRAATILAVAPEGDEIAFLSAVSGLPAIFTVPVAGGPARQLTNVGLARTPGRAPEGFVPPPIRAQDVRWRDGAIDYEAEDGTWELDPRTGRARSRP